MKIAGRIVLIALGFIVLCLVYYCLVPKYEMGRTEDAVLRMNRITGEVCIGGPGGKTILGKEWKEGIVILNGKLF